MRVTKHTHEVVFGRKVDGCPRCEELKAGAEPVRWRQSKQGEQEAARMNAIRSHDFAACAQKNGVCTCFDW